VKQGSRYDPLFERLHHGAEPQVTLRFADVEALLDAPLPSSARKSRTWWSNRKAGVQAAAWLRAGYRVAQVDLAAERVTFSKDYATHSVRRINGNVEWDGEAIKALRTHMKLTQARFADVLGVRQQTVSEWERGAYAPTRASAKHLTRVAEEAGFV
jgi:DNA-binding transcriptional regulator YiaG